MAGCFELKPISIGENRLEVATCCRQLRVSTRAAPSEPRCCVYRFTSMRAPFPADASPPSRETDPTVPVSSILFSIPFLPALFCGGHFSGGHNIELSCPADLRPTVAVYSNDGITSKRHARGQLQRFVTPLHRIDGSYSRRGPIAEGSDTVVPINQQLWSTLQSQGKSLPGRFSHLEARVDHHSKAPAFFFT